MYPVKGSRALLFLGRALVPTVGAMVKNVYPHWLLHRNTVQTNRNKGTKQCSSPPPRFARCAGAHKPCDTFSFPSLVGALVIYVLLCTTVRTIATSGHGKQCLPSEEKYRFGIFDKLTHQISASGLTVDFWGIRESRVGTIFPPRLAHCYLVISMARYHEKPMF